MSKDKEMTTEPYCEAQSGGMECGRPVAKQGQQCDYHNPKPVVDGTSTHNSDTKDIDELIATYLEGLHNPSDDGLYNELRAKRDTEYLKDKIVALLATQKEQLLDRLEEAIGEDEEFYRPYLVASTKISTAHNQTQARNILRSRNQLRTQLRAVLTKEREK